MPLDRAAAAPLPPRIEPPTGPLGPLAAWRAAQRNVLGIIPAAAYREPIVSGGRFVPWKMIQDPDAIERVLKTNVANYVKSDLTREVLRPRQGSNLFISEGSAWRWQRRATAPIFQHRHLAGLAPSMTRSAEATCARLAAREGQVVELFDETITATFDVIQDVLLSGRETLDRRGTGEAVTRFIETVARISLLDVLGVPAWVPRPGRLVARANRQLDDMIDGVIRARRGRGPSNPPDMLDLLMAAEDRETGRRLSPAEIRNNLIAFIIAGHETTSLALAWALWLLAFDRDAQEKARACARAATGDRAPGAEDLEALGYVRQVIEEAMRLYPPAGLMARQAVEADALCGRPVAPGETVMIPVYALHRHERLWDRPDAFDPDRFAPEASAGRHKFAYIPFSGGPRICIGWAFALMEATIILAALVSRFRFEPGPGPAPVPEMILTLRPGGGVRLRVSAV